MQYSLDQFVAFSACEIERRFPGSVAKFRIGALVQQARNRLCMAVPGGPHQGGQAVIVTIVQIGPLCGQQLNHPIVTVDGCPVDRRHPVPIKDGKIGPFLKHQLDDLLASSPSGINQGRPTRCVQRVRVCPASKHQLNRLRVTSCCCFAQDFIGVPCVLGARDDRGRGRRCRETSILLSESMYLDDFLDLHQFFQLLGPIDGGLVPAFRCKL